MAQRAPATKVGAVTGLVGAAGGLGGFVPPLLMGTIYGASGSYAWGLVALALPGPAVDELLDEQAGALADLLILDCANRVGGPGPANSHEAIASKVSGARYARVFNSLGVENLADPQYDDGPADMFFSAPDGADRAAVEQLIEAVGLRPVYLGDGQQEVVDGVLRLYFALVMGQHHGRHLAFRVLER